jgi:hypothetical protein
LIYQFGKDGGLLKESTKSLSEPKKPIQMLLEQLTTTLQMLELFKVEQDRTSHQSFVDLRDVLTSAKGAHLHI